RDGEPGPHRREGRAGQRLVPPGRLGRALHDRARRPRGLRRVPEDAQGRPSARRRHPAGLPRRLDEPRRARDGLDGFAVKGVSTLRLAGGLALAAALWAGRALQLSPYSSLALAGLLAFVGGRPFARGFARSLKTGKADADMLVFLGVWAAMAQAVAAVFVPELLLAPARRPFFEVLAALVFFPSLGRWLEARLVERGGEALWTLARRIPRSVRLVTAGRDSVVPATSAGAGARFRVLPGEHIALDGSVVDGASRVDESLWTGGTAVLEKAPGSRVFGGSLNKTGELLVAAERPAADARLTRLVETVRVGVQAKAVVPGVADQLAASYAPGLLIVAVLAALAWSWKGPEPRLQRALTTLAHVLVAATPWTLGLAAPAALAAGLRRARRMGMRIRNPAVLQVLRVPDVLVVGKTGVLTQGRPALVETLCSPGFAEDDVLRLARAAGEGSGHPYAEAVARRAPAGARASSVESYPGHGVSASVEGRRVLLGALPWLAEHGIVAGPQTLAALAGRSDPTVGVAVDGALAGVAVLSDPLRPSAAEEVAALARLGVKVVLASGDSRGAVEAAASAAGIEQVFSEVREEEKQRLVAGLQAEGRRVAMVGTGFLDAPALAQADFGIALDPAARPGSAREGGTAGFDLAAESADLVVSRLDLASLHDALRLTLRIREVVRENLTWVFVPQLILLPLAAGVLGPAFGIVFQPSYAAAAAAASAFCIAVNSVRRLRL
ncbi:heavy metal translocating P-type ATPase, partial [bacterium]